MADDKPPCAGKGFEHHRQVTVEAGATFGGCGPWRCPDCGDTGSYADFDAYAKRLMTLMPVYRKLQAELLHERAVILVPTEAATGSLGTFMGLEVLRVPGLAEMMMGIPALGWVPDESKLEILASVVADLEQENAPPTEAELQDVRAEWPGRPVFGYDRTGQERRP
jgi:hypothetical protein